MDSNKSLLTGNISEIMQSAYIDYSMSVIVSRALPDVRDGFKPVQRRVLYAMMREGLLHNRAYDKCAGVVGEVLKNYHPLTKTYLNKKHVVLKDKTMPAMPHPPRPAHNKKYRFICLQQQKNKQAKKPRKGSAELQNLSGALLPWGGSQDLFCK